MTKSERELLLLVAKNVRVLLGHSSLVQNANLFVIKATEQIEGAIAAVERQEKEAEG